MNKEIDDHWPDKLKPNELRVGMTIYAFRNVTEEECFLYAGRCELELVQEIKIREQLDDGYFIGVDTTGKSLLLTFPSDYREDGYFTRGACIQMLINTQVEYADQSKEEIKSIKKIISKTIDKNELEQHEDDLQAEEKWLAHYNKKIEKIKDWAANE